MAMGTEVALRFPYGTVPGDLCSGPQLVSWGSISPIGSHLKCKKKRTESVRYAHHSKSPRKCVKHYALRKDGTLSFGNETVGGSYFPVCQCQRSESIREVAGNGTNGSWFNEVDNKKTGPYLDEANMKGVLGLEELQHLKDDKAHTRHDDLTSRQLSRKERGSSLEDEAWRLLQESVVYYCGSPVGTIAANDPSDANVLNYDQVFIRDFIPSGIAFLLKGEYDIVRNFILHTLQLQLTSFKDEFWKASIRRQDSS